MRKWTLRFCEAKPLDKGDTLILASEIGTVNVDRQVLMGALEFLFSIRPISPSAEPPRRAREHRVRVAGQIPLPIRTKLR